jgi:DNA-directed RNA polymerase II subunit RPB2
MNRFNTSFFIPAGNWGLKANRNKIGVAQVLNRMTYNATLSHLRRVNTPLEKSGKLIQPRKLHNTQFGFICPAETPEVHFCTHHQHHQDTAFNP